MIYFNINIRNPLWNRFKSIWHRAGTPKNHKCWEFQVIQNDELFRIEFSWTTRQDHAGVTLELGLFGYTAMFSYYDTRHWDYDKNNWVQYD